MTDFPICLKYVTKEFQRVSTSWCNVDFNLLTSPICLKFVTKDLQPLRLWGTLNVSGRNYYVELCLINVLNSLICFVIQMPLLHLHFGQ